MHCQAISRSSVGFEAPVIGHWSGSFKIRARIIGLPVPLDIALHCAAPERRASGTKQGYRIILPMRHYQNSRCRGRGKAIATGRKTMFTGGPDCAIGCTVEGILKGPPKA